MEIIFLQVFLECHAWYCRDSWDSWLWEKMCKTPRKIRGKFSFSVFMLRLALTFPIYDVLGVIYGKGLCTNETPVFTQHEPLSEVDRGDGVNSKRKLCCFVVVFFSLCWKLNSSLVCRARKPVWQSAWLEKRDLLFSDPTVYYL